jgi:cytochrome P450
MQGGIPAWEPLSAEVLADQRGSHDRMRAACPVAQSPRGVTLFRHADVLAAASDPVTFSSAASTFRQIPNSLDGPEHAAYRALIDGFFTPQRMGALEPRIRACAHALMAALPRGTLIDAVTDIGYPFAIRAQADWLGWQGVEVELLAWLADSHEATRSADRSRTDAAAAAFDDIVAAQIRRRRALGAAAPRDPTAELLDVRICGRPLTDAEVVSILRNWTAGDLGSIAASLGVAIHFLAAHPDIQSALRAAPGELAPAIDEMLRIDDPFLVNRRVVTATTRVAGFTLAAGTRVYLNWASANRDERVFGDPDAYQPREHARHNLVYGAGVHVCPGRPLATLELVVAVEALLRGTSRIVLAPGESLERETYPSGGWRRVPILLS